MSSMKEILMKQVELLAKWNEENINQNAEQVRKNAETIQDLIFTINNYYGWNEKINLQSGHPYTSTGNAQLG